MIDMQQFCVEMMKRLDIQRRNEHFCDVILEVGSGDDQARLKAHRNVLCAASPFFYNALNSDMKEKKDGVIRLEETSKAVMEEVLEYLYTGHVDFNEHNVQNVYDLMALADFFLLSSLKALCVNVIIQSLCFSNCIMAFYIAENYQCPELLKHAKDFIFANFMSVTESEDFLNLNMGQLEEWISSDRIRLNSEEEVFQVIVKWMEKSESRKHERFFQLFRHIRLIYLSHAFVFNSILPHPLVKSDKTCTEFVLNAMKKVSDASEECYFVQPPRSCLKTHEDCLVAFGKKKIFCYLPSEKTWYKLANMLTKRRVGRTMGTFHGKLYTVRNNSAGSCTIEQYDPSGNSWTAVKSTAGMITCRSPSLVYFQGFLYLINGTKNGNEVTNSVHKYNPDTNLWQEVAPLGIARRSVCVVADRNSLYAIGGESDGKCLDVAERFDPQRNSWIRIASTLERKMCSHGAIVNNRVFLFGGLTSRTSGASVKIEMYNPTLNVWSDIENMDAPKYTLSAVSFKEDIFVIGFWGPDSALECSLQVYNVDKNEWKSCPSVTHPAGHLIYTLAPLRIPKHILNVCSMVS